MALILPNLFTALGHLAYALKRSHAYAGGSLAPDVTAAVAGLGVGNADIGGPLATALDSWEAAVSSQLGSGLRTAAGAYLTRVVNADVLLPDRNSIPLALRELVRQMIVQSYRVPACTVSAVASAQAGNVGNGAVVTTTKRGDGLVQENILAETGVLTCTGDNQSGTATANSEPFTYRGDQAPTDVMRFDFPGASGASASLSAVDSAGANPNLLTNSTFETFTVANTPDGWDLGAGTTPGTNLFSEASIIYRGSKSLKFLGNGSTRPAIRQTLMTLRPNQVYAVNLWAKAGGALTSTGTLSVRLVDGSNAVITDDQGSANGFDIALTALTTTYTAYKGVLITPKTLPSTVKLQIEASRGADMVNAEAAYVDALALAPVAFLYPGGPALAVFAGSIPFMSGDGYDFTTANDQAGASYGATWQRVFHRFWNTPSLGLLLPTGPGGATLISDSLIA